MEVEFKLILAVILVLTFLVLTASIVRIIRPTERGLIERLGKYDRFADPGLHIIIPLLERMTVVNVTERMIDANKQEIITNDNLNATVDAQVYFRVRDDEDGVKSAVYNVNDYQRQIVNLARTTLRNIIGGLSLKEANSDRDDINKKLLETLAKETDEWGIKVVRTELKEIEPPDDVQDTMNKVVKAENEKLAATDFATAEETKADGIKRAEIKKAEGEKQSRILSAEGEKQGLILEAEGKAKAIEVEYTAAEEYFTGNAQVLKSLETVTSALEHNTKIVLPTGKGLVNVIGDLSNMTPLPILEPVKDEPVKDENEDDS